MSEKDEIWLTYNGPSFENRMEIQSLTHQLKATERLVRGLIDELYQQKKIHLTSGEVEIFLTLRRGSFGEIITLVLSSSVIQGIISAALYDLIKKILKKEPTPHFDNEQIWESAHEIIIPLTQEGDTLTVALPRVGETLTIIPLDKKTFKEKILEMEKNEVEEVKIVSLTGYVSEARIDKEKDTERFKFKGEGAHKHIPAEFEDHLPLERIRKVFGAKARVSGEGTYKSDELIKLRISEYTPVDEKKLEDY